MPEGCAVGVVQAFEWQYTLSRGNWEAVRRVESQRELNLQVVLGHQEESGRGHYAGKADGKRSKNAVI